jgi:hypothetical protein
MKLIGENTTPAVGNFKSITLRWPANSKVPTIHGKWKRLKDGRIQAIYAPSELAICLMVAELISEPDLLD